MGHLGGLLYSLVILILKILRHHSLPSTTSSLEMATANRGLAKFVFPSPVQQSRDTAPSAVSQCPKAHSSWGLLKEGDRTQRHKPGHEGSWKPSKNAIQDKQKGQKVEFECYQEQSADLCAREGMKTRGGQVKQIQDPSLAFYSAVLTH